jgi:hypothetical protein
MVKTMVSGFDFPLNQSIDFWRYPVTGPKTFRPFGSRRVGEATGFGHTSQAPGALVFPDPFLETKAETMDV